MVENPSDRPETRAAPGNDARDEWLALAEENSDREMAVLATAARRLAPVNVQTPRFPRTPSGDDAA